MEGVTVDPRALVVLYEMMSPVLGSGFADVWASSTGRHTLCGCLETQTHFSSRRIYPEVWPRPRSNVLRQANFVSRSRLVFFLYLREREKERERGSLLRFLFCYFFPLVFTGLWGFFVWAERREEGAITRRRQREKSDIRLFFVDFKGVFGLITFNPSRRFISSNLHRSHHSSTITAPAIITYYTIINDY